MSDIDENSNIPTNHANIRALEARIRPIPKQSNNTIMAIGDFFFKQLLKSKMKDVPLAEQEKIFTILEKNPDFFKNIAEKVQSKMKNGKDQTAAMMETINEHKEELQKVLGK